jgi:lysozyme family protein
MPTPITLTARLRDEYDRLFKTCVILPARTAEVDAMTTRLVANRGRYGAVSGATGVPWHVIAVIHCMEASLKFTCHLHNGDPLTARTVQVPANRPPTGTPPFTWETSAADALTFERLHGGVDWSLAGTLFRLEKYNGFGYRRLHPDVLTPYLWSFSQHYTMGKFVRDGEWSPTARSRQCGAAVLLRRLAERREIEFEDQPAPAEDEAPPVRYSTRLPRDPDAAARARALQEWLNTFPGIFLRVDGIAAKRTSDAFRRVTGRFLEGDPRGA